LRRGNQGFNPSESIKRLIAKDPNKPSKLVI